MKSSITNAYDINAVFDFFGIIRDEILRKFINFALNRLLGKNNDALNALLSLVFRMDSKLEFPTFRRA